MNLEALAAMDDCEHATGKPLEQHMREVTIPHPRTAKEIIADGISAFNYMPSSDAADLILKALRDGGYDILERVSVHKAG